MSGEEEVELRDLLAQTLESNGCLAKIRAQLRANIFLALDEDIQLSKQQPLLNNKVKNYLEKPEGEIMFCLVREFLEFFDLDFSASVFEPESYLGSCYKYEGRQSVIEKLGLEAQDEELSGPVLLHFVKIAQTNSRTLKINLAKINAACESNEASSSLSLENGINGNTHDQFKEDCYLQNNSSEPEINSPEVNKTQMINDPSIFIKDPDLGVTFVKKNIENDVTFNSTRSTEEECNGTENSLDNNKKFTNSNSLVDSSLDSKSKNDKSNKTKCDKLKSKLELPPLQLGKRGSDILPSLYNKDFKEKNYKEFDFDINDDYEEDFMSGSEVEFSLSKVDCPKHLLEELQQSPKSDHLSDCFGALSLEENKTISKSEKVNLDSAARSQKILDNDSTEVSESIMEEISHTSANISSIN